MIEVRVLGPIEVMGPHGAIRVGGPRQRRLLAVLVARANEVVTTDELIELVWDGEPPERIRSGFKAYVARLRSALADGGADGLIVTHPVGYSLEVADEDLDSVRFEAAVESGRAALRIGDSDVAVTLLDEALSLWRGEAYGDLAGEAWVQPSAIRLQELRATAHELRLDALLARGDHADLLPDMNGLIADFPYRDRLRGQRMLALYRSGRHVEALREYQEYRKLLGTDVGVEPGPELMALEQRILAHDDELFLLRPRIRSVRDYELGERIGEGAFSIVFRGTQRSVRREVAVKQIRAELANRPEFVRRFDAEAHLVASLEHPHVVPLYDYWREPGAAFLVMRLLRGGTLASHLLDHRLAATEAVELVTQVGSAIAAAHAAGVVHRDVRATNIFLDEIGNYYLADFGIALVAGGADDPGVALSVGSPAYASPEQLRREAVGPTSDLHSLGIVLYEALTGQLPFTVGRNYAASLQRQIGEPIPSILELRPDLGPELDEVLQRATAKQPTDRYRTAEELIASFTAAVEGSPFPVHVPGRSSTPPGEGVNPYKGLSAFHEADAGHFHGRDRLIDRLLAKMRQPGPSGRFIAAVGPSGSGKSSVVRAGLVPLLRQGAVPGSQDWYITTMVPGTNPFEEFEAALSRVAVVPATGLAQTMGDDARGITRAVHSILPDKDSDLLVVIDQFEELFSLVNEDLRNTFLACITAAIDDPQSRLRLVVTIRADFWDRPLRHPDVARIMEASAVTVIPLAADELEQAIVDPAHAVGADFERGLVSELIADANDQPGALPLLQFTLTELYERRESGLMTRDAYRKVGGITGVLTGKAEDLYSQLSADEQDACRRLFRQLVTLGEGVQDTRRRALRSVVAIGPAAEVVIDIFGAARLLSFDRDPATSEPTVEVSHEALIRQWPRLGEWVDEDRDDLRVQHHLVAAAAEWDSAGRPDEDLYRAGRLETAESWAAANPTEVGDVEADFVKSGAALRDATRRREQRRVRRLRGAVVAAGVVAVVALVASLVAIREQRRADDARADAEIRRMTFEAAEQIDAGETTALLIALEAQRRAPSNLTLGGLQRLLVELPRGWLGALGWRTEYVEVAVADNGRTAVAIGPRGLDVFDIESRDVIDSLDRSDVVAVDVSPTGSLVAVALDDGSLEILARDGLEPILSATIEAPIAAVTFNRDGEELAVGLSDGRLLVTGIDSQLRPETIGFVDGTASSIAWNQDGSLLLVGTGDTSPAYLFDRRSGRLGPTIAADGPFPGSSAVTFADDDPVVANGPIVQFDQGTDDILSRVDGDLVRNGGWLKWLGGNRLIAVAARGQAYQVDLSTGEATPVGQFGDFVSNLAFIGDDRVLTVSNGELNLWSLSGQGVGTTRFPASDGRAVATSDDGQIVMTGFQGQVAVWDVSTGGSPRLLEVLDGAQFARIRSHGAWVATDPDSYQLWTAADGLTEPRPLAGAPVTINFSPDGTLLVMPTRPDNVVHVVETETGRAVIDLQAPASLMPPNVTGPATWTSDVEFSPDGTRMVTATFAGAWQEWDTATWELTSTSEGSDRVFADMAFSPDGSRMAALSFDGELTVGPSSEIAQIDRRVSAHRSIRSGGKALAFSGDGRYVVTEGDDGARLWDATTLEQIGGVFPNETNRHSAELATRGNRLVTQIGDEVVIWNVDIDRWPDLLCQAAGRNMTVAEWQQFGPRDEPYAATCPQWPPSDET